MSTETTMGSLEYFASVVFLIFLEIFKSEQFVVWTLDKKTTDISEQLYLHIVGVVLLLRIY